MIGAYLIHSITLKQYKGKDQWGDPVAATSRTIKARVEYRETVVQKTGTESVVSRMKVLLTNRDIITADFSTRAINTIAYEDKITVDGVDHDIYQIATQSDFCQRYMEVYLA
jgi:hypothetical protein